MVAYDPNIGWYLAAVGVAIYAVAIYYLYQAARSFGGKLGKAIKQVSTGIILIITTTLLVGMTGNLDTQALDLQTSIIMLAITITPGMVGAFLVLAGSRGFVKAAKG